MGLKDPISTTMMRVLFVAIAAVMLLSSTDAHLDQLCSSTCAAHPGRIDFYFGTYHGIQEAKNSPGGKAPGTIYLSNSGGSKLTSSFKEMFAPSSTFTITTVDATKAALIKPAIARSTCLWCISMENTLPRQGILPSDGVNFTFDSLMMAPCSTRPVITSPTPLILYTPDTQVRMAASSVRFGGKQASLKASLRVSTWILLPSISRSTPLYQAIFSVFLTRLSPSQPEIGMKGNSFLILSSL